ncbi:MAG TPA: tripartite tricarboxylate transporter substrate binding protein [Burkholderiales bacterium]|nr:tripartite tricarboxylate transporter substrate binding protein [Burkholderiales bacterium]
MKKLLVGVLVLAAAPLLAQEYPERPVVIVLPLQVGSASDVAVRMFAERLGEGVKQPFVVENVTGAAGLIGADRVAKSRPDGYTLAALNNSILTILPNIQRERVKFNPFDDFVPVHGIANIPTLLSVHESVPVRNVAELVALAKRKPGELNYATGGPGSPQHLAGEMFMAMSGVRMTQVPYKGATAATAGLAGGQTQVMFIAHSLALPFLPSGKIRPIAFAGSKRSPAFPDLPTVAEAGVPGYDYSSWIALFAPKGTPPAVLARLRSESAKAVPGLKDRLEKSGLELWAVPPSELPGVIKEDHARWARVVREANIKAE